MAIHQEITIDAEPDSVYKILTTSKLFAAMTGGRGAEISAKPGGRSTMFGGEIEAVNVETIPGKRLVQAWRAKTWPAGVYSIARFELAKQGKSTKLVFDQAGHPADAEAMLSGGWAKMYWEPMQAALSK